MVASSVIVMENVSGSAEHGCGSALLDAPLPPDPFAADDFDEEAFWAARGATLVPAAESGRWRVGAALAAEPGAVYAGALADLDPQRLDGETRVDLIRAWARVAAWVDAQQQVALAAVVDATEDAGLTGDDARHEVGVALRLSPGSAYDKVQRAVALTGRLADTLAALGRGEISGLQATTIAAMVEPPRRRRDRDRAGPGPRDSPRPDPGRDETDPAPGDHRRRPGRRRSPRRGRPALGAP